MQGHSGLKESQVLWLGEEEYIASSGFGVVRAEGVLLLLLPLLLFVNGAVNSASIPFESHNVVCICTYVHT